MNAKQIHDNPSADQLRSFTEEMPSARVTEFDNVNVQTKVVSRSTASTYVVTEDPAATSQKAMKREEFDRIAAMQDDVHRPAGDGRRRRLHRQRPRLPDRGAPQHRAGQLQYRRDAAAPLLRPHRRRGPRGAGHLHAEPLRARLPGRPLHRGRPGERRHAGPRLRLLRRVQEGRTPHVEHHRLRPGRALAARGLQVDPGERRREGVPDHRPLRDGQDHHDVHDPERFPARAGRLHRAHAGRQGVRVGERLLRQDVLARPRLRAEHLQRGREADVLPRERLPGRRRRR